MRAAELADTSIEYGGEQRLLLTLVDDWSGRVLEIRRQSLGSNIDVATAWGIHELIGSCYLRDAVQRGIDAEADRFGKTIPPIIQAVDELFKTFTRYDEFGVVEFVDPKARNNFWWWRRIPDRGPMADEAAKFVEEMRRERG